MAPKPVPLKEGRAPVHERLVATLFLASLLHGLVILGLTFDASAGEGSAAPGLEVLLVSDEIPESARNDGATYLAQRTQIGAGNTAEAVSPRNRNLALPVPPPLPMPDPASEQHGDDRVLTTHLSTIQVGKSGEGADLAASGDDIPLLLDEQPEQPSGPPDEAGDARLRGPQREQLWITPDTRAATLAPYLSTWRLKVERIGTLNYPTAAHRVGVRASPIVEVAIGADGHLKNASIRRTSGYPDLDQAALAILKLASPFDPFPAELARERDVLRFAYEWQFVGGRIEKGDLSTVP